MAHEPFMQITPKTQVAIIGGGPAGLFMYKRLVDAGRTDLEIHIYERKAELGAGMPYSPEGANEEHVTNVSDNEIPPLVSTIQEWLPTAPPGLLQRFRITPQNFNEYKVLPRLLFGAYLTAQFELLLQAAAEKGIATAVHRRCTVHDIINRGSGEKLTVLTESGGKKFDVVVICTGHNWPKKREGKVPGYFDSPYPPAKLRQRINGSVAIRGASLTAFDALRTLSRENGVFEKSEDGTLTYRLHEGSKDFRLVMHSLRGLLPAIRVHLDDSHLAKDSVLSGEELQAAMQEHDGFVPLDFLFQKNFKEPFRQKAPQFYEKIKDLQLEEFVEAMMALREKLPPFTLFKAEYAEAEKSIRRQQPVYWKEMLAVLSFALNYPAKHLSAEDMLRLKGVLMPLISIVIAFVPQSSAQELLALHEAGVLDLIAVGRESEVIPAEEGGVLYQYTDEEGAAQEAHYPLFVDCIGQPALHFADFPFASLRSSGSISPATLRFRSVEEGKAAAAEGKAVDCDSSGQYYLQVPGITINDHFQVLDQFGAYNEQLYIMAVPYIAGYNPDYSGLDFCEAASARVMEAIGKFMD